MFDSFAAYLQQATGAVGRGDYLNAFQSGLRAAKVPSGQEELRCDAYLVLAHASLEMGFADEALAFAIGAQLIACWRRDHDRESKATMLVQMIHSQWPVLGRETRLETSVH